MLESYLNLIMLLKQICCKQTTFISSQSCTRVDGNKNYCAMPHYFAKTIIFFIANIFANNDGDLYFLNIFSVRKI